MPGSLTVTLYNVVTTLREPARKSGQSPGKTTEWTPPNRWAGEPGSKMALSFAEGRRPDRRELVFPRVGKMRRDKMGH